ncbi:MAG: hypothetical protein IH851_10165 [Armatimonadetes bacterium]|nr:hypothetical protein [Armatimonadota bacterium]
MASGGHVLTYDGEVEPSGLKPFLSGTRVVEVRLMLKALHLPSDQDLERRPYWRRSLRQSARYKQEPKPAFQ